MTLSRNPFLIIAMAIGYGFLYLPIVTLIVFSFNESSLVTIWSGFSTKWYQRLFTDEIMLNACWLSLKIAFMTANLAVVIGTSAAFVIVRYRAFKGRSFFNGLVTAPLVMPEVMTGLALLLLFVFLHQTTGWPTQRGMMTITLGHTTIAIAYVLVVVRTRLSDFDGELEEAALDLGARPITVFWRITMPIIFPGIASGWLLAFTLSLDDVVIASFLSGPGSTTLPMVIFSSVRFGLTPEINALATIIIGLVSIGVIMAGWAARRQTRITKGNRSL